MFILLFFGVTSHTILFAGWTPNTYIEVREDLARLENKLGCQKAVPFEEQCLGTAVLVLKEMCSRELNKRQILISVCGVMHLMHSND